MEPRGNASAVLSSRVLETPAADPPQALSEGAERVLAQAYRPHQPGTGDEPRSYPKTGRARAHTTGMASVSPDVRAQRAKESSDFWLGTAQKLITLTGDSVKRMATQKGREEARFGKVMQDALLEFAKKEAGDTLQKLPYARVITKAIQLSEVFANAAGEAIVKAGVRLDYDRAVAEIVSAREVTPETIRALQFVRGWQRNSARELEGVLRAGLLAVLEQVIDDLFGQVEDTLTKSMKSVVDQVTKHVFRENDILAVLNDVLEDQTSRIPAARLRMERAMFFTLADTWAAMSTSKETQAKLGQLLGGAGGEDPVHVAMLAGMLEVIASGSFEMYAKHIRLREGRDALRLLMTDATRSLILQAREEGVQVVAGDKIEATPGRVTVPESLLKSLDNSQLPPYAIVPLMRRVDEFEAAVARAEAIYRETRERFRAELRALYAKQAADWDVYVDIQGVEKKRIAGLVRLRERTVDGLEEFVRMVENEFGSTWENRYPTRIYFTGSNKTHFYEDHFPVGLGDW